MSQDSLNESASLLAAMTLDEKAAMTAGVDMWTTAAIERLGVPSRRMTDGPSGARGRNWAVAATPALAFPTGSALGATWDPELLRAVGAELGREARARAAHVLLGPTVNLQRSPLAGRTFECFSEDPLLSGVLGAEYVKGVQSEGVAATVKHLAGNEAEWQRNSVDSVIDERTLRELYLLPFERCVRAGALAVMTAYNRLNGDHCPNHAWLLRDILRGEWGFDGIVMTDWWGLLDTRRAAHAGLDLEMPGPGRRYGAAIAAAVRNGEVDEAVVDDIVARLLTVVHRLADTSGEPDVEWTREGPEQRSLVRAASAASMVLIKNEGSSLPLDLRRIRRIAILGPNAAAAHVMGGGSSQVRPQRRQTLLEELRQRWQGHVEIVHAPGPIDSSQPAPLEPWELTNPRGGQGLIVEYFDNPAFSGEPVAVHHGDDFRMQFLGPPGGGIPYPKFSARAAAVYTASASGPHEFVLRTNALARLIVDDRQVNDPDAAGDADWFGALREITCMVELEPGQRVQLCVELVNPEFGTYARTSLSCRRPQRPDALERAVRAARESDVAIVVVGTSDLIESEGFDRRQLQLPDGQDELIDHVVGVNPHTVVVVNSGGPVAMPWLARVPAVVQAWFGGQEMGGALAEVLDGTSEPAGRMPFTVPRRIEDTPTYGNFPGEAGALRYGEGLLIGYRWYDSRNLPVDVPFGHGGSYTTFEWRDITLSPGAIDAGDPVTVEVTVSNTGSRVGSDVVQVYVAPPRENPVFRPRRELRGFGRVCLEPGEERRLTVELDWRSFAYWQPEDSASPYHSQLGDTPFASSVPDRVPPSGWTVTPGRYSIHVAHSIADVAAVLTLDIGGSIEGRR